MKKVRNLVLIVLAVMSAVCIFNTSKANAYVVKQDNVVATLKDTGKGVIVILKNKNKYAVSVTATLVFKNGKKVLDSAEQMNCCLEADRESTLFFIPPVDANYNFKKYSNYKISLYVDKTFATYYGVNKIKVSADSDDSGLSLKVVNKSKKKFASIRVSVIFYDKDKNVVGWDCCSPTCLEGGSESYDKFYYLDDITPDSYKIYVDQAYNY